MTSFFRALGIENPFGGSRSEIELHPTFSGCGCICLLACIVRAPPVETNGGRVATPSSSSGCLRDDAEDFTGGGGRVLLFFAVSVSYRMDGIHVP